LPVASGPLRGGQLTPLEVHAARLEPQGMIFVANSG